MAVFRAAKPRALPEVIAIERSIRTNEDRPIEAGPATLHVLSAQIEATDHGVRFDRLVCNPEVTGSKRRMEVQS